MDDTGEILRNALVACSGVLVWGGLLVWSLRRDPRALRNGFLIIVLAHHLLGLVAFAASGSSTLQLAGDIVALVIVVGIALGLLALPLLLVGNGLVMLRRERRSLGNALSLLTGVALMVLPVVLVVLLRHENPWTGSLAVALLTAQAGISLCFLAFVAHTVLYARIARRAPARAVIVLGSGLVRGGVSPLLAARLERAVAAAEERVGIDGRPVIVPSGGRGRDEPRPEGQVMGEWLLQHGVAAEDVLVEDRARSTRENLLLSVQLLERHDLRAPYLLVTSDYHAPRAAALARTLGISAHAIGAPTALYYWPSAYLREFTAVLLEHRVLLILLALAVVGMGSLTWLSVSAR